MLENYAFPQANNSNNLTAQMDGEPVPFCPHSACIVCEGLNIISQADE
jgi:hypothetical protein